MTGRNLLMLLALQMSLCLIIHAGLIHRPSFSDDDLFAMLEAHGLANNEDDLNSSLYDKYRASFYQTFLPSLYDEKTIQQLINHQKNAKRSKLNLHTNLNLPRYLRHVE